MFAFTKTLQQKRHNMMLTQSSIQEALDRFHKIFVHDEIDKIATESSFLRRATNKIQPLHFLLMMTLQMLRHQLQSLTSMTDLIAAMPGASQVSPQAIAERLKNNYTVRFLERCYSRILNERLQLTSDQSSVKGILGRFNNVFAEDSTLCNLHMQASEFFRGVGGGASKAAYKIHLLWNCATSDITSLTITSGTVTDQSTCNYILAFIKPGDLILRDLGYFSLATFNTIDEANAYFVSRLKRGLVIYTAEGELIKDLCKHIEKLLERAPLAELKVLIGKTAKLPVRLVVGRVPDDVYNKRMRKAREVAKSQGYQVTKAAKEWNRYTIFITNAPESKLKGEELFVVYKLRWQIELIFKSWKSLLHIDMIKGHNGNRIKCFILARLITILLISSLFSHVSRCVYLSTGRHLSLSKFTSWIMRNIEIFMNSSVAHMLIKRLDSFIPYCCMQQRSRKTTSELLEVSATYHYLYLSTEELLQCA